MKKIYRSVKEFQLTNKEFKKDEENRVKKKNDETNNSEKFPQTERFAFKD